MYLQGVVIDKELNIIRGLKTISGIGQKKAEEICNLCHIHHKLKISELDNQQERRVQTLVAKMRVGHLLKKETTSDIFNLINNKTYRGYKHLLGLPVKGQRTKTNAKTTKTHKNSLI
ncbi:ribosomal protein S13, partial (mitochondrion) [Fonticula alba]